MIDTWPSDVSFYHGDRQCVDDAFILAVVLDLIGKPCMVIGVIQKGENQAK